MSPGSVLVIDDDEWVGRLLAVALREAGYEVFHSASAVSGYEAAVEKQPDCIICDVDLPDVDGFWVARKIRMSPDRVSVTPFLFLSGLDDRDTRLQGFHVGADVYMTKPFRIDEVVAQVGALVQMAKRLRQHRRTFLSVPPMEAAMTGDLAQMSVATVLTLLDMERRSGTLEVASKLGQATLTILAGAIGGATLNGQNQEPLELLRTLLAWNEGRFSFHPDSTRAKSSADTSINALLMEAVRLEDEKHAGEIPDPTSEPPGSRRRLPRIGRTTSTSELAVPSSTDAPGPATAPPLAATPPPPAAIAEPVPKVADAVVTPKPLAPRVAPPGAPTSPAAPQRAPAGSLTLGPPAPAHGAGASTAPGSLITPSPASVERAKLDQVLDELIPISLPASSMTPDIPSAGGSSTSAAPAPAVIESGWSEPPPAAAPRPPPPPVPRFSKTPAAPFARKPTPAPLPAVAPRASGVPRPAPTPKPVGAPVGTKPPIPAPTRQGSGEK